MQAQMETTQTPAPELDGILDPLVAVKPISPATHSLMDYILLVILLIVPPALRFPKSVIRLYRAQGLILLAYVALTDQPLAVKPLIPFPVHGKIDPFNVGTFALQSFLPGFRKDKRALFFNIIFTAFTGIVVYLTDWNGKTKTNN